MKKKISSAAQRFVVHLKLLWLTGVVAGTDGSRSGAVLQDAKCHLIV